MKRLRFLSCALVITTSAIVIASLGVEAQGPPPGPQPPPPAKGAPAPAPAPPPAPAPAPPQQPAEPGHPFATLTQSELGRWQAGLGSFQQPFNPPQGLGPVFTQAACFQCHNAAAPGGAGTRLVTHFGRLVAGEFDPMIAFGGPQLQDNGIGRFNGVNFVGEVVPPQATIVAKRRTIPLFGLGLVDAVPDAVFVAMAQHEAENSPLTAGVANMVTDPVTGSTRVGKFGWKAQEPSILAFTADAMVNEIGITTPVFPNENCPQGNCALLAANPALTHPNEQGTNGIQTLADFTTFLAPPPPGPNAAAQQAGETLFNQVGCTNCHMPTLQTAANASPSLSGVTFSPYSDFLLHDMGSLGDGIVQNGAGATMMRTAPLWGLRFEPSYLHDGRAATPDAAIRAHAGQGLTSRNQYVNLTAAQQTQLLNFLNSL